MQEQPANPPSKSALKLYGGVGFSISASSSVVFGLSALNEMQYSLARDDDVLARGIAGAAGAAFLAGCFLLVYLTGCIVSAIRDSSNS